MNLLNPPRTGDGLITCASDEGRIEIWSPAPNLIIFRWSGTAIERVAREVEVVHDRLMGQRGAGW